MTAQTVTVVRSAESKMLRISDLIIPSPRPVNVQICGRSYFVWRGRTYPYPCDEMEGARLDCLHNIIYVIALEGELHTVRLQPPSPKLQNAQLQSPTEAEPLRILDVGFGSAEWVTQMSLKYPDASIYGIDLQGLAGSRHIDYAKVFPNLTLLCPVDFHDEDWDVALEAFDLVHLGLLSGSVSNWSELLRKALRHVKPGTGQIELVEIDWRPRSHSHFPDSGLPLLRWYEDMVTATRRLGMSLEYPDDMGHLLRHAGFTAVRELRIEIPYNNRRRDGTERLLSDWFRAAIGAPDEQGIEGFSMFPLMSGMGYSVEKVKEICAEVRETLRFPSEMYCNLHVWSARRPADGIMAGQE